MKRIGYISLLKEVWFEILLDIPPLRFILIETGRSFEVVIDESESSSYIC